ncbi:DUF3300 domain-containing protein [Methylomonas sp. MgM2]
MTHSKPLLGSNFRQLALFRAVLFALALTPVGCNKEEETASKAADSGSIATAPTESTVSNQAANPPMNDLESLLAPIALYPDPLLAELLVASTYPLEVVQAARWLETNPDLSTLSSKDWDASILRLTSVPMVLKMMNDHLDWTTRLGNTFLAKPDEVMDTIQALRKRAKDGGFLKSTPEQEVDAQVVSVEQPPEASGAVVTSTPVQKEVITIKPAKADTVYVPQYNPEVVYQAPMAPAPSSTVVNVNSAPASSYYPAYYPTTTTTTTTDDSWVNFATGALVGGLLTWGIMEWTRNDWNYGYGYPPYVGHYYGNSVCRNGNCWHGGGYYGDRGNINYNRNINISGNDINVDRRGYFKQADLKPSQLPAGWQPDPRHRRGVDYPKDAQQRLGRIQQQPALAGQRLGAAQTLPANSRGFAEGGRGSVSGGAGARRLSSDDVRQRLQKSDSQARRNKATASDVQNRLGSTQRRDNNAFKGASASDRSTRRQSERGANSRKSVGMGQRQAQERNLSNKKSAQSSRRLNESANFNQGRTEQTRSKPRQTGGQERWQQQMATQRRSETTRPNAFESARNANASRDFSQRGAFSTQRSASGGNFRASDREGFRGGGGRRR